MTTTDRLPALAVPVAGELLAGDVVRVDPMRNPYRTYLDNLRSAQSRTAMRGCLDRLARIMRGAALDDREVTGEDFPWQILRYEHTIRLRAKLLEQGWSAAYINKHLVGLRRVLKESWRLGDLSAEEYERAIDLEGERIETLPAGRHISADVLALLLDVCHDPDNPGNPADVRDGAMFAVLYTSGVRREELVSRMLADWRPESKGLRVLGKGNKQRMAYVPDDTAALIEEWIVVRGRTPGALFPSTWKGGRLRTDPKGRPARMTGQGLRKILMKRFAQAAEIDPSLREEKYGAHDFRRTFIGELLDAGVDLATAQALVGHSSPATTARYDRRPEKTRQNAVNRLRLPDRPQRHAGDQ
ncbi:tyrosine-type recombinase/integrase [Nonomuraea sp. CA-143628]|uniref:tyrosine-type recombinase/integrase n=1 Tax=Nonomuraea sp. CA-143628 TaxID=3239997 RepID=UPI003D8F0B7D